MKITLLAAATILAGLALSGSFSAEKARAIPAPAVDASAGSTPSEVAVFAGGCFWGVQGVYQHTKGVTSAVSGYAGGSQKTASYGAVSGGRSEHAEAVQITFDPRQVSYGTLLHVFFSVVHDPTELNRQGPDTGPQYRSTIFPTSPDQARVAKAYIAQLNAAQAYGAPVVTTIELDRPFYPAEAYHQDYLTRHPSQPYIAINDLPKIDALKATFPALYRPTPVLVGAR